MANIIPESQIESYENELKQKIELFNYDIQIFIEKAKEVQELLDVLSVVYNTTGGTEKLKQIASIEFDTINLSKLGEEMRRITPKHSTITQIESININPKKYENKTIDLF